VRLGFVGCGKWASKLASAFRECGAEVVAYDRKTPWKPGDKLGYVPIATGAPTTSSAGHMPVAALDGFGLHMPWRSQLADKSIDAIIAVAPPEVTTEVALACAAAGKPVMATKPLFDHPETIRAPFYVDFWRLWSEAFIETKRRAQEAMSVPYVFNYERSLAGIGPYRSFPGAFDYGPHVLAELFDIYGDEWKPCRYYKETRGDGELFTISRGGPFSITATFGNGADVPERSIGHADGEPYLEESSHIGPEEKSAVLRRFCQSFLDDISEGFVDTRLLNLSRRGTEELRKIREMAVGS